MVLERLREATLRFRKKEVKKTPQNNEIPAEKYLASIREVNKTQIEAYIEALKAKTKRFNGNEVGVIAFGSSVNPEQSRWHAPEDIDIRVATSAKPMSTDQEKAVEELALATRSFLHKSGLYYEERERTRHKKHVKETSCNEETGEEEIVDWLDYHNEDPSFEVKPLNGGLPLHISISGFGREDLESHLAEERKQEQHFSVLAIL